jgi:O-methyltransferase
MGIFSKRKKRFEDLNFPSDFEEMHKSICHKVREYTMTSLERIFGLIEAVKYISKQGIDGDIVECGVWKGGSMMAIAETLLLMNDATRSLYLYDTFEGMPAPTKEDKNFRDQRADILLKKEESFKDKSSVWAYRALEKVQQAMDLTNYNSSLIHFIKGKVEDTIPQTLPNKIALLRLDTDWYESTKHELRYLFPLLASGGVVIIDDYGFWKGARKAVDEYFEENCIRILLNRMDETGRIAVKQ